MKKLLLFPLLSGALLLSGTAHGQYKYTRKSSTVPAEKKTYDYVSRKNNSSGNKAPAVYKPALSAGVKKSSSTLSPALAMKNPPIINDPIDIYSSESSMDIELLDATLYVHFATGATQTNTPISDIDYEFTCSPDYFYHGAQHILVSSITTKNTDVAGINKIQLYKKSFDHWSVTYNDFVIKYSDSIHSHHDYNYWKGFQGGKIELKLPGNEPLQVDKMILVLKFSKGTKTIVWDTPKNLISTTNQSTTFSYLDFKFSQNFEPMN